MTVVTCYPKVTVHARRSPFGILSDTSLALFCIASTSSLTIQATRSIYQRHTYVHIPRPYLHRFPTHTRTRSAVWRFHSDPISRFRSNSLTAFLHSVTYPQSIDSC